ncbi:MAG: hypothetical protein KJ579_12030, partial [Verrucomicrobia bacterium]|nr:hypothetical protein [Verrucomicrobiota bacterium]
MNEESARSIRVRLQGGEPFEMPAGTTVRALCGRRPPPPGLSWLGALVNNEAVTLSYPLEVDSEVTLLTMCESHGWRIYRNSVSFLL